MCSTAARVAICWSGRDHKKWFATFYFNVWIFLFEFIINFNLRFFQDIFLVLTIIIWPYTLAGNIPFISCRSWNSWSCPKVISKISVSSEIVSLLLCHFASDQPINLSQKILRPMNCTHCNMSSLLATEVCNLFSVTVSPQIRDRPICTAALVSFDWLCLTSESREPASLSIAFCIPAFFALFKRRYNSLTN